MPLTEIEDFLKNKDISNIETQNMPLDTVTLVQIPASRIVWVEESLCVRLCFRGSHAEAPGQYKKLPDYIGKRQMQIIGFSREITLIDYGITNDTYLGGFKNSGQMKK